MNAGKPVAIRTEADRALPAILCEAKAIEAQHVTYVIVGRRIRASFVPTEEAFHAVIDCQSILLTGRTRKDGVGLTQCGGNALLPRIDEGSEVRELASDIAKKLFFMTVQFARVCAQFLSNEIQNDAEATTAEEMTASAESSATQWSKRFLRRLIVLSAKSSASENPG